VLKSKLWVSHGWLTSSSKLQRCLELCRFAQALLKTKVTRWKAELAKDPCASFIRIDGVLLEVRNQKEEYCAWSLIATTSRMLDLSLLLLSDLMNVSHFLFVSNPCLMFLNSSCILFTPNQVYSYNHSALQVLLYWLSLSSTLLSVVHFRAMSL
jgi:hypothetical protein